MASAVIIIGDLFATRGKRYFGTESGEVFPITIGFHTRLSDERMLQLTAYAFRLEYDENKEQETKKED
jgi:hypothetical protein